MTSAAMQRASSGIIVGAGPAGLSIARALAREGVRAVCVDPRAHAAWRTTWGLWDDEIVRHELHDAVAAGCDAPVVRFAHGDERALPRGYRILDPERLRARLGAGVHRERARVTEVTAGAVSLEDGRTWRAPFVIDARGARDTRCAQTALGQVVRARGVPTYLMDFALDQDDGDARPTFGYVVPLDDERVLVEETALAAAPPLEDAVLRRRLARRLRALGLEGAIDDDAPLEHVRIPLDVSPALPRGGPLRVGVGGGAVHPATGYALARILDDAPAVARGVRAALDAGADPARVAHQAWRAQWTVERRAARRMLEHGRDVLLALDLQGQRDFFRAFFKLEGARQRAFLTSGSGPRALAAAMAGMWGDLPWRLRVRALLGGRGATLPVVTASDRGARADLV